MALYGWQTPPPPAYNNAGFEAYKPPRPSRSAPRSTFKKPRPVAPKRRLVIDPLAPTPDSTLRQRALNLTNEQLGPILAQIKQAIAERSASGEAAIRGTTSALGGLLQSAAPQTKAAYDEAIGQGTQVNSELANRLGSFGQNLGGEIAQKLDYAPQSTQSNLAAGAVNTATGAANANFARGAADISNLVSESAHGQEYAAKLPGIAALTGEQHSRELEAQLNRELADQLAAQSTKAQDTFAQIYMHYVDQEWNKTLARTSGQFNSVKLEQAAKDKAADRAFKRAVQNWKQANAKAERSQRETDAQRRARIAQQNADTSAKNADTTRANANRGGANYYTDSKGRKVPKGYHYNAQGELVKIPTSKGGANYAQLFTKPRHHQ